MNFKLHSQFKPTGDQPQAIEKLTQGLNMGLSDQVLLGVTGSGKTFTMANIIANVNRPTLVLAHNKTLAAQLCSEFREFFPENAVEYFISYYDYYQPEAYIAQTVDARHGRDDDHVPALGQRTRRAVAQTLDLVVDGGILFDVGIRLGNICLRLVIVIVGNEVFHGVFRKKLAELRAQLRGERFVVRQHERRAV